MTRGPRRPAKAALRVSVTDAWGRRVSGAAAAGLTTWLAAAAPRGTRGDVSIALVSDAAIQRLNRVHRAVDRPTDVLSFPAEPTRRTRMTRTRRTGGPAGPWDLQDLRTRRTRRTSRTRRTRALGDIAIALGVAARQARAAGHSLRTEVRILALHGLLHLLGYDHEADRGQMERVEERLRRRAGLPAGLILRGARPSRARTK